MSSCSKMREALETLKDFVESGSRAESIINEALEADEPKMMDTEQEEVLDAAMDAAIDNDEVGDPEEPLLLLPNFWSQEEKDGVTKMLQDEDTSLKKMAYKIIERWGGFRDWQRNDMSVHETGRDKYGTFVFKVYGGRNYCLSQNAPYYFSQLSTMMMFAKNCGVRIWPLNIKFDVADDLWDAEFGIDFNKDDNAAWLLRGAKMLDLVEEEAVPVEGEAIPEEESPTIK